MSEKKKIATSKLAPRIRVFIPPDEGLSSIFGEPIQTDTKGRLFVLVPAYPEIKQIITDLHPSWSIADEFIEID